MSLLAAGVGAAIFGAGLWGIFGWEAAALFGGGCLMAIGVEELLM